MQHNIETNSWLNYLVYSLSRIRFLCLLMLHFCFCYLLYSFSLFFNLIHLFKCAKKEEEECPEADRKSFKRAHACAIQQHAPNDRIFLLFHTVNFNICRFLIDLSHINLFFIGVFLSFFLRMTECWEFFLRSIIDDILTSQ